MTDKVLKIRTNITSQIGSRRASAAVLQSSAGQLNLIPQKKDNQQHFDYNLA